MTDKVIEILEKKGITEFSEIKIGNPVNIVPAQAHDFSRSISMGSDNGGGCFAGSCWAAIIFVGTIVSMVYGMEYIRGSDMTRGQENLAIFGMVLGFMGGVACSGLVCLAGCNSDD